MKNNRNNISYHEKDLKKQWITQKQHDTFNKKLLEVLW